MIHRHLIALLISGFMTLSAEVEMNEKGYPAHHKTISDTPSDNQTQQDQDTHSIAVDEAKTDVHKSPSEQKLEPVKIIDSDVDMNMTSSEDDTLEDEDEQDQQIEQIQKSTEEGKSELTTEELARTISTLVGNLLTHCNISVTRIDNLKIAKNIKKKNTEQLILIQEKLLKIKRTLPSYSNNREKLTGLLQVLEIISKGLAKGLNESFQEVLVFSPEKKSTRGYRKIIHKATKSSVNKVIKGLANTNRAIKRGTNKLLGIFKRKSHKNATSTDPLKMLIEQTQGHIADSEDLIQNLGKTWVNKAYGGFIGWWNTPLFHIAPLGNTPVYPGSIAKRIVIYGTNTVLIMYNLSPEAVKNIPIPWLRDAIINVKKKLGRNVTKFEQMAQSVENQATPDDEFYFIPDLQNASYIPDDFPALKQNEDGSLVIIERDKKATINNVTTPEPTPWNALKSWGHKTVYGYTNPTPSTDTKTYSVVLKKTEAEMTFDSQDTLLQHVQSSGIMYEFKDENKKNDKVEYVVKFRKPKFQGNKNNSETTSSQKILTPEEQKEADIKKQINDYVYYQTTGLNKPYIFIPETSRGFIVENLTPDKIVERKVYSTSFVDDYENPVSPAVVYQPLSLNGVTQQKLILQREGNGVLDKFKSLFSWIVEPDLNTTFTLPIAAYLASFIYDDCKFLVEQIPNMQNWAHAKLSGSEARLEVEFSTSKITFEDVVGRDYIKEKLMPYIKFVENPKLALQAGITVPRGIIFAGEPQTGKTMMAQAFLGELTQAVKKQGSGRLFRMITVQVHHLVQVGLKPYLAWMKQYAPCVVFCDEFELTGAQRDQNRQLLAEFLTALSGFDTAEDIDKMVFFLVATNHPENIDHALQEPGRMGTHIYFEIPSAQERHSFFMHAFDKAHIPTQDLDIQELVQETAACSYGKLKEIVGNIITRAEYRKEPVNQSHINVTLDEMVRRIVTDEYDIPQEQRVALAARYGAQAFTSLVLNPHKKFVGATIYKITPNFKDKIVAKNYGLLEKNPNYSTENKKVLQDNEGRPSMIYGGFFSYNIHDNFGLVSHNEKLKLCKIALAGVVGQDVLGLDHIDFDSDMLLAFQYAREIVLNGIKEELLPKVIREEKRTEVYNLIQECKAEVRELLVTNKDSYQKIVDLLQRRYIIRTSDIKECFNITSLQLEAYFSRLNTPQNT